MNYWLDLFTGTTWKEFRDAGARISGFRPRLRRTAAKVKPGDVFLCYLTGVMRWVGALEVISPSQDTTPIWKDQDFPVRFDVRPLVLLDPEFGVPMEHLEGKVEFYRGAQDAGKFRGIVRRSPNLLRRSEDGPFVLELLRKAEREPIARPVDPRKLARRPLFKVVRRKGKKRVPVVVSVPEPEETSAPTQVSFVALPITTPEHTEIQYHLVRLGAELGLNVWVAKNDRSKEWNGTALGAMQHVIDELPMQFNEATHRTIEMIDVLWLRGNSIVAAFEIEVTTSVYSGLLRMGDLLALQPNLDVKLYIVAPDERRSKVEQETLRPTFRFAERPLHEVCGFLPFSKLLQAVKGIQALGLASSLKPDFLLRTAEFFEAKEET